MRFKEWDNYLDSMLKHVKYTPDRKRIRLEFGEHMEDMFDEYVSSGMSEEEAMTTVLDNLGDSKEVGQLMNRAHNALIGWIWQALRLCLIVTLIVCAVPMYTGAERLADAFNSWRAGYETFSAHGEPVRVIPVDEKVRVDDHTLCFDEVREYEDGTIEVRYREKVSILRSNYITGIDISAHDDKDRKLADLRSDDYTGSGILEYRQELFQKAGDDTEAIFIEYEGKEDRPFSNIKNDLYMKRHFEIEVDMSGEEG